MGTTADKLQRLVEGKQAIVNAVNSKANTSLSINSKLSDVASAINNISSSGSGTDMLQARVDATNSCSYLFYNYAGDNVDFISNLDTSSVTSMGSMFYNCNALTTIPQLDTSSVTSMGSMFYNCNALTSVPQLDTSSVIKLFSMFYGCSKLTTIDITYYNLSSNSSYFVKSCTALKALIIREFGANYVLDTTSFSSSGIANGTGYIYVPRDMVDILKSETNWSTHASQIRALEDYTVDGTTTGALDESKI